MPDLFLSIFRFVRLLFSGHQAVAIENAALRLQGIELLPDFSEPLGRLVRELTA